MDDFLGFLRGVGNIWKRESKYMQVLVKIYAKLVKIYESKDFEYPPWVPEIRKDVKSIQNILKIQ